MAELADAAVYFFRPLEPSEELKAQHFSTGVKPRHSRSAGALAKIDWESHAIHEAIKAAAVAHGMKLPKIAMPLRVMVTGERKPLDQRCRWSCSAGMRRSSALMSGLPFSGDSGKASCGSDAGWFH